jgi:hypothetical protein
MTSVLIHVVTDTPSIDALVFFKNLLVFYQAKTKLMLLIFSYENTVISRMCSVEIPQRVAMHNKRETVICVCISQLKCQYSTISLSGNKLRRNRA